MSDEALDILAEHVTELATHHQRVTQGLSKAQESITYFSKVLLLTSSAVGQSLVVGRVIEREAYFALRIANRLLPGSVSLPNEAIGTDEEEATLYEQGIRFGMFYHQDETSGYVAHYHVSRLFPITDEQFHCFEEVGFDPAYITDQDWYIDLYDTVVAALETRPDSPKRPTCGRCKSRNVALATYYDGVALERVAIREQPDRLEIRTGHEVHDHVIQHQRRVFRCLEEKCEWESENMPEDEFPETHACDHAGSQIEALYEVNETNTI